MNYTGLPLENLKKHKMYSSFRYNIQDADFANMQLISKYIKGVKFLLCVIDTYGKCARVVLLKDKKNRY